MSDEPLSTPSGGASRPTDRTSDSSRPTTRHHPNYAARRMLVGTVIIAAIFAAGVVGWQITHGDETNDDRTRSTWTALAVVDRTAGDVTYLDGAGQVIGESLANGRTGSVHGVDGTLALVSSLRVAVLDAPGPDDEPLVVEIPRATSVTPVSTVEERFLVVGSPTGGNVIVIDPAGGVAYDVDEIVGDTLPTEPLMLVDTLRFNADGSMFAIADATNFQTIVVRPDEPAPLFLPDQPLAVGDDLVATSQTVGLQADVALVALDRSTKASVPTEIPAGGVFDDDQHLVMVSIDGGVFRIESGDDEAARLGEVAIPTGQNVAWARPAADGRRLVVAGRTFEAVVDLNGETLFSTTFTGDVDVLPPEPGWACLPVGGDGGAHSIVDLVTGEQLADLTGVTIREVADDGCAVLVDRAGSTEVVTADGTAVLGATTSALLGPGGRSVVRSTAAGTTELVLLGDDLAITSVVDITEAVAGTPLIAFVPTPAG